MSDFLRALGYEPLRYWLLAWTCSSLWALSCVLVADPRAAANGASRGPGRGLSLFGSPWAYALLLLAAMAALRWPAICFYKAVNPDEPQFLAGALTMLARHEFWWLDPTTSGPLVVLPLTLPGLMGLPIDYAAGRAVGLLLSWGVVLFVYLTLRHVHGDRLARLLSLPLACFMILLNFWDFTAYCSEWLPLFLCSAAVWLGLTAFATDGILTSRRRLAAAGIVLGILPFGKLQALPLGAAIGLTVLVFVFLQPGADRRRRVQDAALFLGATAAGFLALVTWLWTTGNAHGFYVSFVLHNLYYAQDRAVPWADSPAELQYLAGFSWGFSSFLYGLLVLAVVGLLALRRLPRPAWRPIVGGWFLLGAAFYAVSAPGRAYPHYLLFLTMPLALAAAVPFGHLLRQAGGSRALRVGLVALLVLAGAGGQLAERLLAVRPWLRLRTDPRQLAGIVGLLDQFKKPGDTLAVWGWRPELYVDTQLPQGVRVGETERELKTYPLTAYFRERYLADLEASRPEFFVDAVGRGGFVFQDRATAGLETFAGLNDYVGRHYALLAEVDTFRLYRRHDPPAAHGP